MLTANLNRSCNYARIQHSRTSQVGTAHRCHRHIPPPLHVAFSQPVHGTGLQIYDVVALANVCLDVVLPVSKLPSAETAATEAFFNQLSAIPHNHQQWEVGGSCNFMIAAARLGLQVGSIGHVGNDLYGTYLDGVLQVNRFSTESAWPKHLALISCQSTHAPALILRISIP